LQDHKAKSHRLAVFESPCEYNQAREKNNSSEFLPFFFASEERLLNILKLTRGSVSPFGLLNDAQRQTTFIIDADVLLYPKVGFHPNINTQTVILNTDDFLKFLNTRGIKWAKDNF
jgi:Ala-tRNA(Pro) deacylase